MPQFNKKETPNRWYNMSYQSNNVINDDLHNKAKQFIAKIIKDNFTVPEMHSYIHGEIIFRIDTETPIATLDEMVKKIEKPFAEYKPDRLLYSITLASTTAGDSPVQIMYVEGDSGMDQRFLESIKDFHKNP
jgi:Cdc6-like AAA superfamily ATPase